MVSEIKEKFKRNLFEFSKHAVDQSIIRMISLEEINEAIKTIEIIEDYPDDKYGSSCLLLGFTNNKRPLHIQCSYPSRDHIKIITLYEPDESIWQDYKIRR